MHNVSSAEKQNAIHSPSFVEIYHHGVNFALLFGLFPSRCLTACVICVLGPKIQDGMAHPTKFTKF